MLKFHVRCATEFRKCYVVWRGPLAATLNICHPDTIASIQSSNIPKPEIYDFNKPFLGEREFCLYRNHWQSLYIVFHVYDFVDEGEN